MDRATIYNQEQGRDYDILALQRYTMKAVGGLELAFCGQSDTVVNGLVATRDSPASMSVNISAGIIYAQDDADATSWSDLAADHSQIQQQGFSPAQQITLSTTGLSSGQSRWILIEAAFAQVDTIPTDDPTDGLLYYYNSANPGQPFQGPGNNGQPQNTARTGVLQIRALAGSPAATGSEAPPQPSGGSVPLYLIDITFGQTQIQTADILVAGPSAGLNVPNNYPAAPFLAGLLNAHHSGSAGQAPQIDLTSEVQNTLPLGHLPASSARSGGGLGTIYVYAGDPNGNVAGSQAGGTGVAAPDMCWDTANKIMWVCTVSGNAATAQWSAIIPPPVTSYTASYGAGSGNFIVPAGVYVLRRVMLWGPGGGGSGVNGTAHTTGGGGRGGGYCEMVNYGVNPGQSLHYVVGAGGAGGAAGENAGADGSADSTFIGMTAHFGIGGVPGGAGGLTPSGATGGNAMNVGGTTGQPTIPSLAIGGSGGTAFCGTVAQGGTTSNNGANATSPGGGGGGAGSLAAGSFSGGNGADGLLVIEI